MPLYHKPRSLFNKKNFNCCAVVIETYFMFKILCLAYVRVARAYALAVIALLERSYAILAPVAIGIEHVNDYIAIRNSCAIQEDQDRDSMKRC